jgi:hypothetical protein
MFFGLGLAINNVGIAGKRSSGPSIQYGSGVFNGSTSRLIVGYKNWSLGSSFTIEYWSKASIATTDGSLLTVMSQNADSNCIDIFYQYGDLIVRNNTHVCPEPIPGVWTHVAIVNDAGVSTVYYNGVSQNTGNWGGTLNDTTNNLYIGQRGPLSMDSPEYLTGDGIQHFNGKLSDIHISNLALYGNDYVFNVDFAYGDVKITDDGAGNLYLIFLVTNSAITDTIHVGDTVKINWGGQDHSTIVAGALGPVPNDPWVATYPNSAGYLLTDNFGVTGQPDINVGVVTVTRINPARLPTAISGTLFLWRPTDQSLNTDNSYYNSTIYNTGVTYSSDMWFD